MTNHNVCIVRMICLDKSANLQFCERTIRANDPVFRDPRIRVGDRWLAGTRSER